MLIWVFATLAGEVMEGDTRQFDEWVLSALRQPSDPGRREGPGWLAWGAEDITALGSPTVLGLTVLAVTGYLFLHGLYRNGLFIFVASVGGWILNWLLKQAFARTRPDIVPHLREVVSSSFPSGHALTSAAVYLTLGALLMRIAEGRLASYYCIAIAMFLTFLVGSSRVSRRALSDRRGRRLADRYDVGAPVLGRRAHARAPGRPEAREGTTPEAQRRLRQA